MCAKTIKLKEADKLDSIIKGCQKGKPSAQEKLYKHFYGYAMSVSLIYADDPEDAVEILNDGFLKVFQNIKKHQKDKSLKAWIRRIMVNTAIDHHRKEKKHKYHSQLTEAYNLSSSEGILDEMSEQDILLAVQSLPSSYRMVFNLYVIEGFSHKEIGEKLDIAESTSRANLSAANRKLREAIKGQYQHHESA